MLYCTLVFLVDKVNNFSLSFPKQILYGCVDYGSQVDVMCMIYYVRGTPSEYAIFVTGTGKVDYCWS